MATAGTPSVITARDGHGHQHTKGGAVKGEGSGPSSTTVIGRQLLNHAMRAVLQVRMLQLENAALIDGLR